MLAFSARKRAWVRRIDRLGYAWGLFRPKSLPAPEDVRSILVLELWGIGDVVLATTVLAGLRARYPKAKLVLLAQAHSEQILRHCPWPDEVIVFKFPWTVPSGKYRLWLYPWFGLWRLFYALRRERFTLAVDARLDLRNNLILWLSGAQHRVGYAEGGGGFCLTHVVQRDPAHEHRVEEWQDLLTALGTAGNRFTPLVCVSPAERASARAWLKRRGIRRGARFLGIHPGAASPLRRWPVEKWAAAIQKVPFSSNLQWLVFGEPGSGEAAKLASLIPGAILVEGDLRWFLSVASLCELVLTNDSGPVHLAAALGIPVLAVFGPQRPEWFRPWGADHRLVLAPGIECRGCYDRCVQSAPWCMQKITVEDTAAAVTKLAADLGLTVKRHGQERTGDNPMDKPSGKS
jgi:ADP-heptose:LPS heptosyltransferase